MEISRSEIVTLDECPTKAYQTYREDGHGYVPSGSYSNLTALQGIAGHKGGELFFNVGPNSNWREAIAETFHKLDEPHRTIRTTLIRRALLAWSIVRFPKLIQEWKPLGAEVPFKWELAPGFRQPLRLDNILEHREHGGLAIYDFKFTGSPDLNWSERKRISKQTALYLKALKDHATRNGRDVAGMMYECVVIGKWDDKKNMQKSPFVMGYKNKSGKVQPKYAYGYPIVDLTTYSDDKWLEWANGTNALEGLVWTTDLFDLHDDDLQRTHEATATQVMDWAIKLQRVENSMDKTAEAFRQFPRNPEACLKFGWEHACPFYGRCWKGHKLDKETFEPRKDHHAIEVEI